jgi:D-alanyl-D-alanine carboxypeptidase
VPATYLSMTHPYSAGSLCSTARDFARWQRALAGGRVVTPQSYAMMTTPGKLNDGTPMVYGFGLEASQVGTHTSIIHGGSVNGFTSSAMVFPADSVNIVVLTNSGGGGTPLALNIARVLFGMPIVALPRPLVATPLSDAERDRVIGVYDLALPGGVTLVLRVSLDQGQLVGQADGPRQRAFAMVYQGNLRFASPVDRSMFLTFVEVDGKITTLRLEQTGTTISGPRRP